MNIKKLFCNLIILISAIIAGTWSVNAQVPEMEADAVAADSISPVDRAMDKAVQLYDKVSRLKLDGAQDEVLFPEVYECYTSALEALNLSEERSAAWQRAKGILRDVNKDLLEGAYYYSGTNNQGELAKFSQAYIDTQLLPAFKGETFKRDDRSFPSIVYCAASGAYNAKNFDKAIEYFKIYFSTGEEKLREKIYLFMGQACLNSGRYDLAVSAMTDGMKAYPANYQLVEIGIKACTDGGHGEALQPFLDKAFTVKPNDEQLLAIQGKLYEDEQEYQKALEIYDRLDQLKPNSMTTAKRSALCYYNLGVSYYNKAILEDDEKIAKRYNRQAKSYFQGATEKLEEILANDPMSLKYLKALAVSYGCMDEKEKFESVNNRIQALGESPVNNFNMPPVMAYADDNSKNFGRADGGVPEAKIEAPLYSEWAKEYVTERLGKWAKKGEFEKMDDFSNRVNDATIKAEYERLCREAEKEYLALYASKLRLTDLTLKPYDTDNEVYLVESSYGPIYLNVPLKNNEAELFKAGWAGMHFKSPSYYIDNDQVRIASITFVAPSGKSYQYNSKADLTYAYTRVKVDLDRILDDGSNRNTAQNNAYRDINITKKSDVDMNIPQTAKVAENTVAVIIANENYTNVAPVPSALHDGETFKEYCHLTLGLPEQNIRLYKNATYGNMVRAVREIKNTVNSLGGAADVIVYYAGHGMPDEATKDAFLLPVDGDATVTESCYSLGKFYDELGEMNAKSVMVFLDACFSGSQRDGSMLVSARGVAIKPKETAPKGNMFTLSATSGQETALPYREKNHGLFTYYLLKKLQETKGNVTLKELSDDVIKNVKQQSNLINQKAQTPQVSVSGNMSANWTKKKLRD